jgi:glyoxylase-like metal-dependent hydrolase (beta-lactamase superfamily II)
MILESFPVGPLQANCTLIGNETSALVFDPGDEAARIAGYLEEHGLTLKQIILTHAHLDHAGGAARLRKLTGAPVLLHPADLDLLNSMGTQAAWMGMEPPEMHPPDGELAEGTIVGQEVLPLRVLFTPGHTQGSCCLYSEEQKLLIAGDTLFAGSVGRTDLPGGDFRKLQESLQLLMKLPDETRVICGHGPTTTIGRERRSNPFLRQTI